MKYIHAKVTVLALLIAFSGLTGCKKFLDVNNNPNQSTDDNVTPELLAVGASVSMGSRAASGNYNPVSFWIGYLAQAGDYAITADVATYNIDFTFGNGLWSNNYNTLFDLELAKRKALAKGDSVLAGTMMVFSAKLYQELADTYGDIPYSQAFDYQSTRTPAYDKATDIYSALQKKLDTAITYLKRTPRSNFNDNVGKVVKISLGQWVKFANTLKLRLLLRQSEVSGFSPATEIAKITANGGVLGTGENVNVNPGYVNDDNKQNPFYANFGYLTTGADGDNFNRANEYMISVMTGHEDPRLKRVYQPQANGSVVGCVFGLAQGNPLGNASSKFGPGLLGDTKDAGAKQDQFIYPAFESMFLYAEAAARGWFPADAKTAYQNAVKESFSWLGLTSAQATTYMTDNKDANWDSLAAKSPTPTAKAKFVTYQKYIALTGVDPLEAWADMRRLNMVDDKSYRSVYPGALNGSACGVPIRFLYPQTEYTTNKDNVSKEGTINQFTSKLFWQP
ncbi:MAG: SusD/RagB family nutrient-binding outer membrane lipoprotein [Niabella sp.]|nr:SusD/RagB family nutrient-binding outer membrane lipoprotein [Niabella sp.]